MQPPTAADIRVWSRVDWADPDLAYPPPAEGDTDPLQVLVDRAVTYVTTVTGRKFDSSVPALHEPAMQQAVQMRTEQLAYQQRGDTVETAGDIDLIASFSAGSYSETRKDTERVTNPRVLNPWPALNDLLWLLMTLAPGEVNDEVQSMFDYWRYVLGLTPAMPAWQMIEVDWGNRSPLGPGGVYAPYQLWLDYYG